MPRGFQLSFQLKGIECDISPKDNGELGLQRGIFRYVKDESWYGSSCEKGCLAKFRSQERECKISCMKKMELEKFTNLHINERTEKEIIKDTLVLFENSIVDKEGVMATSKDYLYYPHGKSWIGGRPPKLRCSNRLYLKVTDVYEPNG